MMRRIAMMACALMALGAIAADASISASIYCGSLSGSGLVEIVVDQRTYLLPIECGRTRI